MSAYDEEGLYMTDYEKQQIAALKTKGLGYMRIAKELGLNVNTVKSFCRRNISQPEQEGHICLCCGKPVEQTPHRKEKKFCSDKCRMSWWSRNRDKMNHKNLEERSCKACGSLFSVASSSNRKYCSHACYINFRFGGGSNE